MQFRHAAVRVTAKGLFDGRGQAILDYLPRESSTIAIRIAKGISNSTT